MICFCHWVPEPALSGIALQPHMHEAESVTQGPKCSFQALPCSLLSAQGFGLHSLQVMQHTPTFTVPRFEEQKTQVCGVLNIHAVSRHYITKAANILFELLSHNSDAVFKAEGFGKLAVREGTKPIIVLLSRALLLSRASVSRISPGLSHPSH